MVVTTDLAELPDLTSWYLLTNLPAPNTKQAQESELSAADVAEVARLYSLRGWIEQSYKQVKNSLGWAHYQVRKDMAIRRHWQLVCCALTFCWWEEADSLEAQASPSVIVGDEAADAPAAEETAEGGERKTESTIALSWPEALRRVRAWLEPYVVMLLRYWRAFSDKPPPSGLKALLEWVFSGRGLYLYAR